MSELPDRPSLDHLRKQAKARLKTLRQLKPEASLSDAQHALAREYGFASWPKLRAVIAGRAARRGPSFFPRFTRTARQSLFFSWHEANRLRSGIVDPPHLLLGLMRASAGREMRMIGPSELLLDGARAFVAQRVPAVVPVPPDRHIAIGDRTNRVLRAAVDEANANRHQRVGLVHLLIGVLLEGDATTAGLLERMGVNARRLRAQLAASANEE